MQNPLKLIHEASERTAEPRRAERNLVRLSEAADIEPFVPHISEAARLFASSQFLANFSIQHPGELLSALGDFQTPATKERISKEADSALPLDMADAEESSRVGIEGLMKAIRLFKKRMLLRITLRDITGTTDIQGAMEELSSLAEAITEKALGLSGRIMSRRFGEPSSDSGDTVGGLCLIGLGKLGGEELNYSSDIDLIAAYGSDEGQTSGVLSPAGVRIGRISAHEFYVKAVEMTAKLLSTATEDGIGYRVDLRLRPQGQKGEIAMPLDGYRAYYESWGRTWERMVLLRARPVAGDAEVGGEFMNLIGPFLWRSAMDYSEVEEIRAMKKKIDSTFLKDDIKRGYGGIREAEFFVQTFQLIYGTERPAMRTHRLSDAVRALGETGFIPAEDLARLRENYLYLRRIEHYLQMMDDLQTHALPRSSEDIEALGRRLGYRGGKPFLSDLKVRRMQIKNMYNSLLGTKEDIHAEAMSLLEAGWEDEELSGFLSFRGVKDIEAGLFCLKRIRERAGEFKTPGEREHARRALPDLLEEALRAESPDRGLHGLDSFLSVHGIKEAYLSALAENRELLSGVMKILSLSPYLTRAFLSNPAYLNRLIEEFPIRKTMRRTEEEIKRVIRHAEDFHISLTEYKITEELRLGAFFLMDIIKTPNLLRYLSHLADSVIRAVVTAHRAGGLTVMAMGKLGGREITYGSDLDLVFVSAKPAEKPKIVKKAEAIIKTLSSYTPRGLLYSIDMRLRPDGSRGVLVKDLEGYRDYYGKSARPWELQALLKARPVAGDLKLGYAFMEMAKETVIERGEQVKKEDVAGMRKRIIEELSSEKEGIDIKLGPGGIEEIDFYLQRLALNNAREHPGLAGLVVQNTPALLHRLRKHGILTSDSADTLSAAYEYMRRLETFLRLSEGNVITPDSEVSALAAKFMGQGDANRLIEHVRGLRERVVGIVLN